jgi:hypothetical protein
MLISYNIFIVSFFYELVLLLEWGGWAEKCTGSLLVDLERMALEVYIEYILSKLSNNQNIYVVIIATHFRQFFSTHAPQSCPTLNL